MAKGDRLHARRRISKKLRKLIANRAVDLWALDEVPSFNDRDHVAACGFRRRPGHPARRIPHPTRNNLIQFTATDATTEFNNYTGVIYLDSAAEDCSTGIGLSSYELGNDVFLTDFTQAAFTAGTPGTWTGPQVLSPLNVFPYSSFSAGTDGIAVAPGNSHLAVITGEFGGNTIAVLQLPSTSGSGTPALVDYAVAALPDGFSSGYDPHTMTAYTSPNNGKAYGLFSNAPPVSALWVVDMEALLAAPRDASNPHAVDPTYDLVAHGIVTIITL